jgi:putative PIN family toxin of toxin-antitoxin system
VTLRIVPDTGVLVIGALREGSGSQVIVSAWQRGEVSFITSEALLAEFRNVMRDVFGAPLATVERWDRLIRKKAQVVSPTETVTDCRDPSDNRVLEAATEGKAEYIVTFDDDLWKMSSYRGTKILKVRDFLRHSGLPPRRRMIRRQGR